MKKNTEAEKIKSLFLFMEENNGKQYSIAPVVRSLSINPCITAYLFKNNIVTSQLIDGNKKSYTLNVKCTEELIEACIEFISDNKKINSLRTNERRKKKHGVSPDYIIDRFVRNMY